MSTCQHLSSDCIDVRSKGDLRWRRRRCKECGTVFTTMELPIDTDLVRRGKPMEKSAREQCARRFNLLDAATMKQRLVKAFDFLSGD